MAVNLKRAIHDSHQMSRHYALLKPCRATDTEHWVSFQNAKIHKHLRGKMEEKHSAKLQCTFVLAKGLKPGNLHSAFIVFFIHLICQSGVQFLLVIGISSHEHFCLE